LKSVTACEHSPGVWIFPPVICFMLWDCTTSSNLKTNRLLETRSLKRLRPGLLTRFTSLPVCTGH
jgi:hypothetical protein